MEFATVLAAARSLGFEDRPRLAETLWQEIKRNLRMVSVTNWQQELDRPMAADKANPDDAVAWEVVRVCQ